eukprot:scaffold5641_cov86-Skeletonema_marinoi.AAC.6
MNSYAAAPAPDIRNDDMHLADETAAEEVSADEVAIIFSFLSHADIMRARVCKTWRDAATKTLVPLCDFKIDSERSYNAMRVMTAALPNLQQISIHSLGRGHKYSDGEDPHESCARVTANFMTHDIDMISSFTKLRVLHFENAPLIGRYPVLFNFPLLRELSVSSSHLLKFDLGRLSAGCPSLKSLKMSGNRPHLNLTGNLRSLRVLKDTLEEVDVANCQQIEGDFMDLADFPRLKVLELWDTATTGDVRDIGEDDFPALESLGLPTTVCGVNPSPLATDPIAIQRRFVLVSLETLPRLIIRAGSRLGWSWYSDDHSCEINWLDPEPSSESGDYETYIEELRSLRWRVNFYRGYHVPPTEDEYNRLLQP